MMRQCIRSGDWAIVLVALAIAVGTHWIAATPAVASGPSRAIVDVSGRRVASWSTAVARIDTIAGAIGPVVVETKDGAVRVIKSSCPGKWCEREGAISSPGRAIVCLPNRLVIRIDGVPRPSLVDAVTQ